MTFREFERDTEERGKIVDFLTSDKLFWTDSLQIGLANCHAHACIWSAPLGISQIRYSYLI